MLSLPTHGNQSGNWTGGGGGGEGAFISCFQKTLVCVCACACDQFTKSNRSTQVCIVPCTAALAPSTHSTIHQHKTGTPTAGHSAQGGQPSTDTTQCTPTTVHYSRSLPGPLSHGSAQEASVHCCYRCWHQLSQNLKKGTTTH